MTRPLCQGPPAEYWHTGDDGNRLALMLCNSCPLRRGMYCDAGLPDPHPHGVVRAGVAYTDEGRALPVCACGYPQTAYLGGDVGPCPRCETPDVPIPDPKLVLRWRVRDLYNAGLSDKSMGPILHRTPRTILAIRRAQGWTTKRKATSATKAAA